VLRRILDSYRGSNRKIKELHNLHSSPNTCRFTVTKTMNWWGIRSMYGRGKNNTEIPSENLKGRHELGDY
jgi:hypothetical protein